MDKELEKIINNYKMKFFQSNENDRTELSHKNYIDMYSHTDYELKTIIIFEKYPKVSNKLFFDIKKEKIMSVLDTKIEEEIYKNHNQLCMKWDTNVKEKYNKSRGDDGFFPLLDLEIAQTRKELKEELYTDTLAESIVDFLSEKNPLFENFDLEIQNKEIKKFLKNKNNKRKFHNNITKSRFRKTYKRQYTTQLGEKLGEILHQGYLPWRQLYLLINHSTQTFYVISGSGKGSGSRQYHAFGSHLFTELNSVKNIKSHVIALDENGDTFQWDYDFFLFVNKDTKSNYEIDKNESDSILAKAKGINNINEIEFDCFVKTGKVLEWEKT